MAAIGVEAVEDLAGQLTGGREHQHAAGLGLRLDAVLQQAVQDRQRERRGLAGAGLGDADDVAAGKGERDGLGLDRGGSDVVLFSKRSRNGVGEAEVLKGSQKSGSFHIDVSPPRLLAAGRWRRVKNTRVLGASIVWADGASQKPPNGA